MNTVDAIESRFQIVLDNFSLTERVVDYLCNVYAHQLPYPHVTVIMESAFGTVHLPGSNCGFFTTPVIHQALLDIRKTLAFLNLRYGYKRDALETYIDKRHGNNFNILDLNLPSVSPKELEALSMTVTGSPPNSIFKDILIYTDTQLAHFTDAPHEPDMINIFHACQLMKEAILTFIFDRAGLPRPAIQPRS